MKRYLISTITAILVLSMALSVFGQEQVMQRDNIKERSQSTTGEKKSQRTSQVNQKASIGRIPTGREEQLKAIAEIQEQLEKLKTTIESVDEGAFRRFGELSEEERTKVRENMTKAAQSRQLAMRKVEEKLEVLRETRQRGVQPLMPIRELQAIREVAVKEKATQTASSIARLIARYHDELQTIRELAVKEKAKQTAGRLKKLIDRYQKELIEPRTKEPVKIPEQQRKGPAILEFEKSPTKEQPAKQGSTK